MSQMEPDGPPAADENGAEAPEADVAEQRAVVNEERTDEWLEDIPFDADEADVLDQGVDVELDEDDYR